MNIHIGADHRGFGLKQVIINHLEILGHTVTDHGAHEKDPNDDYPQFARPVAQAVADHVAEVGILLCGSGVGVSIVANKVHGVRAALVHDVPAAAEARHDDDCNVLALAADTTTAELAQEIVDTFIQTPFSGEERHERRISELREIEHGDIFDQWSQIKRTTNTQVGAQHFIREGDVLFLRMGKNIGFEQDGKGSEFTRAVLVLRTFNRDVFFGTALTTQEKDHPLYVPIGKINGKGNTVILSQSRLYDQRRAIRKIGHIAPETLQYVRERIRTALKL